jgi:hypothetical protein
MSNELFRYMQAYKKINPTDEAEEEFIENLFLVLYLAAPLPENKPYFKRAEGLHLINILIKYVQQPHLHTMQARRTFLTNLVSALFSRFFLETKSIQENVRSNY